MGALPVQLAAGLPGGVLRCEPRVEAVRPRTVEIAVQVGREEIATRAVVVATDPVTAAALLPGLPVPRMHALTTLYHVAPTAPARGPTLHLDGTGGPLANTVVLTEAAPGYSPDGRVFGVLVVPGDRRPRVRADGAPRARRGLPPCRLIT